MALLEFQQVTKAYDTRTGRREVLCGVDLRLEAGEVLALVGPSGAGKTTLLYLAAGLLRPNGGTIRFDARDLADLPAGASARLRREEIGLVFQNNLALSALPVWENAVLPILLNGGRLRDGRRQALELLDRVGLAELADAPTQALSGGQRRRLGLARAMGLRPRLLLADEPTADLDEATAARIERVMFDWLAEQGCAALIVTHTPSIERAAQGVLRLEAGRLVAGRPAGAGGD